MEKVIYILLILFPAFTLSGNELDKFVKESSFRQLKPCSDEVFLRRTYLVLTGRLPQPEKAEHFLNGVNPEKRALLIDSLLDTEEFVRYRVMRWGDILRIKSEFPSNLWPNGVQAYNRWLYEQISANVPYNEFVRRLLLSQGSNFRSPAVNFYRAFLKKTPENIYQNINVLFLGNRNCTDEGAACFEQIRFKSTKEWKEELIYIDFEQKARFKTIHLADNRQILLQEGEDWRKTYVDWLTHPQNRRFAEVMANRLWFWTFGKGIVNEPDDWGMHNPPSNQALLDYLTRQFISSGYDTKALLKLILNSDTYQSANTPEGFFVAQRLPAEVLVDALADLTGISDEYRSRVPEPFTYYPAGTRSVDLGDATVSSSALELFGRVSRDISLESQRNSTLTSRQLLYLMNARELEDRIRKSTILTELCKQKKNIPDLCRAITLMTLSRYPTHEEVKIYKEYAQQQNLTLRNLASDILWTQINSAEFLYNH